MSPRSPPTVLVVEDESLTRLDVADHLRECGFDVLEAADGATALEVVQSAPVAVVFTDIMMPGQPDGLGLAHWIRTHAPSLPVLLTSADQAMAAAVPERWLFIAKPYDVAHVAARIRDLLQADR